MASREWWFRWGNWSIYYLCLNHSILKSNKVSLVETGALKSNKVSLVETGALKSNKVSLVETGALKSDI